MLKEIDFLKGNFQKIIDLINANIFWKDINGCYLGCNQYVLDWFGFTSQEELIGKSSYEVLNIPQHEIAQFLANDKLALKNGVFDGEEYATINGVRRTYQARKITFYDELGNPAGMFGTALDITDQKTLLEFQRKKLEEQLQLFQVIDSVNTSIYWKDKASHKYLGCNQYMLNLFGIKTREEIIGKTDFDFLPKEDAARLRKIDQSVIENGRFEGEERVVLPCGNTKTYFTSKNQLIDSTGNIVGLVGNSIDITEQREVEDLVEREHQQFRTIVNQVVHDIISPLSALRMIIPRLTEVPEKQRITLKQATAQIEDIANDLLRQYRPEENKDAGRPEQEILFIFMKLSLILSEKRLEFSSLPVLFNHQISPDAYFAFIHANRKDWLRMLSNLVNNAVDALDGKEGLVQLELYIEGDDVVMVVADTGKGMTAQVRDKILQGVAVTEGKNNGHGIGMMQVLDTLRKNNGKLEIESSPDAGTRMTVRFARAVTPQWAATELNLCRDQTVLILDDDQFIHGAWDTHFTTVLQNNPDMKIIHFTEGSKLLDYLIALSPAEMSKVYLLSDYELLKQKMNGLDIIQQMQIRQAMLVTSHYDNSGVIERVKELNISVLPKRLASKIPIKLYAEKMVSV